jgi:hypothetical protein
MGRPVRLRLRTVDGTPVTESRVMTTANHVSCSPWLKMVTVPRSSRDRGSSSIFFNPVPVLAHPPSARNNVSRGTRCRAEPDRDASPLPILTLRGTLLHHSAAVLMDRASAAARRLHHDEPNASFESQRTVGVQGVRPCCHRAAGASCCSSSWITAATPDRPIQSWWPTGSSVPSPLAPRPVDQGRGTRATGRPVTS